MRNFAEIAKPLYGLTSKGVKFTWEKEHKDVFQLLKTKLPRRPTLAFPNLHHPFVIQASSSETAPGAVLLQIVAG